MIWMVWISHVSYCTKGTERDDIVLCMSLVHVSTVQFVSLDCRCICLATSGDQDRGVAVRKEKSANSLTEQKRCASEIFIRYSEIVQTDSDCKPDIFLHIDDNRWALEKVKLEVKDPMLHISKCSRESGRCMCISPFFCCDLAPKVWCRCKGDTAGDWEYHRYIISFEFVTHWPLAACLTAWQERVVYRKLFLSMLRSLQKSHTFLMWVVEESEGQWFQSWKEQCFDTQMMQPIIHPASPLLGTFLQKYRWGAEYTRLMDVGMLPRRASGSHVSSCVESSSGQVTQQSLILVYILVMISKQIL